jgi:hypothetical protein
LYTEADVRDVNALRQEVLRLRGLLIRAIELMEAGGYQEISAAYQLLTDEMADWTDDDLCLSDVPTKEK